MKKGDLQKLVHNQIMSSFLLDDGKKQILISRLAHFSSEQLQLLSERLGDEGELISDALKKIMDKKLHDADGPKFIEELFRIIQKGKKKLDKTEESIEKKKEDKAAEKLLSQL